MLSNIFRPWGHIDWLLPKVKKKHWNVLGCLSTEERCIGVLNSLPKNIDGLYLEILDPESEYLQRAKEKRADNKVFIPERINIQSYNLLVSPRTIKKVITEYIAKYGENIIFDISSFPKRYFFPICKLLVQSDNIENLIITYTIPKGYYPGHLAEDPSDLSYIPMFNNSRFPDQKVESVTVGVGFLPFNLPEVLSDEFPDAKVNLIFPFPPGPPSYQRTWEFVRQIERGGINHDRLIVRVDALDISRCFDHIFALTHQGTNQTLFAPYGPKPHSLAMALFAIKHNVDVYYRQPKIYNPDYCLGIKEKDGRPEVYAYCIKVNGNNLY